MGLINSANGVFKRNRAIRAACISSTFSALQIASICRVVTYQGGSWRLLLLLLQMKHMKTPLSFVFLSFSTRAEHRGHLQGQREQGGDGEHAAAV